MKSTLKKFLSITLVVSMLMSMCTFVFADEVYDSSVQIEKTEGGDTVYYTCNNAGVFPATSTDTTATKNNNDSNPKVSVSKTIAGTNKENEFAITLTVETTEEIKQTTATPDAAVVMVMDYSGSMDWCSSCGKSEGNHYHAFVDNNKNGYCDVCWGTDKADHQHPYEKNTYNSNCKICGKSKDNERHHAWAGSRLAAAQEAAENFLRSYAGFDAAGNFSDPGACRYVSLVTFCGSATLQKDWIDLHQGVTGNDAASKAAAAANLKTVIDIINGTETDSMTNPTAALNLAEGRLENTPKNGAGKAIDNKFVVFLTDGEPQGTQKPTVSKGGDYQWPAGYDSSKYSDGYDYEALRAYRICNKLGAKLYTVAFGLGNSTATTVLSKIATKPFTAESADQLKIAFEDIITTIQLEVDAWKVNDPMGPYINLLGGYSSSAGVYPGTNSFQWNLRESQPYSTDKATGKVVYKLTYNVALDVPSIPEDDLDNAFKTNGKTTLTYFLKQTNSTTKETEYLNDKGEVVPISQSELTIDFKVPAVTAVLPDVPYTINYWYKDKETDEYVQDKAKTETGTGELYSTITTDSTKGDKDGYVSAGGDIGVQTLRWVAEGDTTTNVFNLKYDPIPATVVVKHWVVTERTTDTGTVITGPELRNTNSYPETGDKLWKGDKFTEEDLLDLAVQKKVKDADGTEYKTDAYENVTLNDDQTVINIYYLKTEEGRTPVNYEVHYYYGSYSWKLVNGVYTRVAPEGDDYVEKVDQAILNGTGYLNETKTFSDYADDTYTLDEVLFNGADNNDAFSVQLGSNPNVVKVYYSKDAENKPEAATLTIVHKYYDLTIGGRVPVDSKTFYEKNAAAVHAGDTYTASNLSNEDYKLVTAAGDMTKTMVAGPNEIVVEYEHDAKIPVTVIENHYYTEYEWVVDHKTGEGSYQVKETQSRDDITGYEVKDQVWYAGQYYTPRNLANGWVLVEATSDEEGRELVSDSNIFNMYYILEPDPDGAADVTVNHKYFTKSSYVDDAGVVHIDEINEVAEMRDSDPTYYGVVGEVVDLAGYNRADDEFVLKSASSADQKTTLSAPGGQYTFEYLKTIPSTLVATKAYVKPIYKTYDAAGNLSDTDDSAEPVALTGPFYAGQTYTVTADTIDSFEKGSFTHDADDAANVKTIFPLVETEGMDNLFVLVYSYKDDSRVPAKVQIVDHYYSVVEYSDADGVFHRDIVENDKQVPGTVYTANADGDRLYVGDTFITTGKGTPLTYEVDTREGIVQPADEITLAAPETTVDFYWYSFSNKDLHPATVKVIHHYTIHDEHPDVADRVWDSDPYEDPTTYYAGAYYPATPDYADGAFKEENIQDDLTTPADALTAKGTQLHEGENVIDIYYVKTVDTRVNTTAKVVHNYYHDAEALAEGTTEATYVENPSVLEADSYTATKRTENQSIAYVVDSADPTDYTITVDKDAAKNVITISYVRADSKYTVVHEYYKNGSLVGSTTSEKAAKAGDEIKDSDIEKVTTYEGVTYNFSSATPSSIVVAADGSSVITLRYNRTTGGGGGGGGGGGYTPTPKPDPIPEPPVDDEEIVDEDVPLAALPVPGDEELEDFEEEEVPLANVPKTSDMALFWLASSALSGMGLGALNLKKREDEDEQ